jgi:hypothetical protein
MVDSYEYYGTYDPDAKAEVNLEAGIRDWLWTMDLMFEFIKNEKPKMLDRFSKDVVNKYSKDLNRRDLTLKDVGFDRILDDESVLGSYEIVKNLALQLILKYIPLEKGYTLTDENISLKRLDILRARHMLLYPRIVTLVEILGRIEGIEFFKNFVQYWGKEQAKKRRSEDTIEHARENYVKFWKESDSFEFGVVDTHEAAFLAKFDKCVWYESMKDAEDQELAYYTVCYPGPRIGRHVHKNISMRRSVTLFTGDFCDELRWDRHVHDEPEQPSHEYSSKIVPKK